MKSRRRRIRSFQAPAGITLDPVVAGTILAKWRTFRLRRPSSTAHPELTPREDEVLRVIVEGLAAKAITKRLVVATETVENDKIRIFDKVGVRSQAQAVAVAIGHGLRTPRGLVAYG